MKTAVRVYGKYTRASRRYRSEAPQPASTRVNVIPWSSNAYSKLSPVATALASLLCRLAEIPIHLGGKISECRVRRDILIQFALVDFVKRVVWRMVYIEIVPAVLPRRYHRHA